MPYLDVETRGQLTFQKYQELGTVTTQKKTGRPTKLNELSTQTIQHEIHKLGKHSRIAPKKPYLRPQDFQCWLAFAQAHRHWTINKWAKVIWTDKLAFELGKWVDQSVMIWGGFCAAHCSKIVFLDGRMNSQEMVQQVYFPALRPFIKKMEQAPWIQGQHCLLLMEDNAPIHKAAFSNQWREQNGILKMDWPAHSPDLNPIKNIWKSMKSQISKLYQPQTLDELKHAIQTLWDDLHYGILNNYL
ncbi:hypothetical protein O181_131428 [Austropuccinia psidii MF-1]|uniref:Tc1-like transposase DDE domain-containing protein n=1 Tax=Austropuccinia psidii MF-1 TaxID=1389203 RepID=A0A9Q3L1X4_9BASI|nr:hypothetical protein [Austropuccinia psidii MF-1]